MARGTLLLLLAGLGLRPVENLFRIVAVALLGYMMLKHERFLILFAVVVPIVAAGPLVRRFPQLAASRPGCGGFPTGALPRLATAGLLSAVLGSALLKSPAPSPLTTLAAALRSAPELGIAGPVYNDYDFGGFLIAQGVKTFIHGRTDQLFLGGFISELRKAIYAPDSAAFATILAGRGVTWALVSPGSEEVRHLNALPGWRRVHEDAAAVVYSRH